MTKEVFIERMTWKEARNAATEGYVVAIVVGSTEQHGPHLPLGTDVFIPIGIAEAVASNVKMIIAPPITYGYYSQVRSGGGGEQFTGTTSVRSSTLIGLITDVMEACIRHGFKRFLILSGHYENSQLVAESVQNAMKSSKADIRTLVVNYWELISQDVLNRVFGSDFPGWEVEHAGIAETSIMMMLKPELVRTEQMRDYDMPRRPLYDIIPPPEDIVPRDGVPWKTTPASREKGELLVHAAADKIAEAIKNDLMK